MESKELNQMLATFEAECDELMNNLQNYDVMPHEAKELASKFLGARYKLERVVRYISNELIMRDVSEKSAYKTAFDSVDSKANVTKVKAIAQADKNYLVQMKKRQELENDKKYWEGLRDVFTDAHILYRGMAKV